MSLTGLLRDTGSPLRALFRECLPKTKTFVTNLNRELRALPLNTVGSSDPGLSGTAIDYRLRYYFGMTAISDTVAWQGAGRLEASLSTFADSPLSGTLHDFLRQVERDVTSLNPVGVRLSVADELRLARDCVALSYFEQFYRSVVAVIAFGAKNAIFDGARDGSLRSSSEILQLPTVETVEDVAAMSAAFFETQFPLFSARNFVLNPTFEGSSDVGGADADIVLGNTLVEFKSTAKASPFLGDDLYQLLSYACLDYSDQYQIRKVGLSVLRRNAFREWDIESLVDTLSGGRTNYRVFRERFHAVAANLRDAPARA